MAYDKVVDSTQLNADLTSVANAIRTKGGTSAQLAFPSGFVSAIGDIPSGGGGKTLLADYTASEDVSQISISGNDFDNYHMFLLELIGNLSKAEWIYPAVNQESQTTFYWPTGSGATAFAYKVPMIRKPYGTPDRWLTSDRLFIPAAGASGGLAVLQANIDNGFLSMEFKLYANTSLFLTGFNVKLWGITI